MERKIRINKRSQRGGREEWRINRGLNILMKIGKKASSESGGEKY